MRAVRLVLCSCAYRFVGKFLKRMERSGDGPGRFTNVFVKNLDPETTEEQLSKHFSEAGAITNAVIMRDDKGDSKGFGFVNFEDSVAAEIAVEKLNGSLLGKHPCSANPACPCVTR